MGMHSYVTMITMHICSSHSLTHSGVIAVDSGSIKQMSLLTILEWWNRVSSTLSPRSTLCCMSALILAVCPSSHFIGAALRCLQSIATLHQGFKLFMEDVLHVSYVHVQLVYGLIALPKQLTKQVPSLLQLLYPGWEGLQTC